MEFFGALGKVLGGVFGAALASLIITPLCYISERILPKPSSAPLQFLVGIGYMFLGLFALHFSYFLSFDSPVPVPNLSIFEVNRSIDLANVLEDSLRATILVLPYFFIFYALSFYVYRSLKLHRFLRIYVATLTFIVVMLVWVIVFPWSLERYLQLFY